MNQNPIYSHRASQTQGPAWLPALAAALSLSISPASHAQALPTSPAPVVQFEYDAQGNPTRVIQAPNVLSFATRHSYDTLLRKRSTADARAGITRLDYNGRDQVTQVTDPRSLITSSPRNGLGDVTSLQSPDTGSGARYYDAAGNLFSGTDGRSATATYSHDTLNRLRSVSYSHAGCGIQTFTWSYDQTGPGFSHGIGRLTSTGHPAGSSAYAYDALGRLVTHTQLALNATGANVSLSTRYAYDAAGHIISMTFPSGRVLYINRSNGLASSITLAASAGAPAQLLMTQLQHEPFGAVRAWQWQYNNGPQWHERVFDSAARLVRYPLGSVLRNVSYDAADRISAYTHIDRYSGVASTASAALNQAFSHDEVGRLVRFTGGGAIVGYAYDANGNRLRTVRISSAEGSVFRNHTIANTSNRLLAIDNPTRNLTHDGAGNTTVDVQNSKGWLAIYDATGRQSELATLNAGTGGPRFRYDYNAQGQRIAKWLNTTQQHVGIAFVYDQQGQVLGEYNHLTGAALREYIWFQGMPVAVIAYEQLVSSLPAPVFYIHSDHLNTPRVVLDRNGVQRWSWFDAPFGDSSPQTNPMGLGEFELNLRMPGQYFDKESGLSQNWHREYDASLGRYTQSDPIGLQGGINTYAYVGGNPISRIDPDGRLAFAIPFIPAIITGADLAIGAAIGVGAYAIDRMFSNSNRPPPGSVPISGSPWSGDHGGIKGALGLGGRDSVFIDPQGNVWVQRPDGSWSNEGPASDYTGSGKASGRRGKDRDKNCP